MTETKLDEVTGVAVEMSDAGIVRLALVNAKGDALMAAVLNPVQLDAVIQTLLDAQRRSAGKA